MLNQYELIDDMITKVDKLVDAHGIQKCALAIELVQQLSALKNGLKAEADERDKPAVAEPPEEPPQGWEKL